MYVYIQNKVQVKHGKGKGFDQASIYQQKNSAAGGGAFKQKYGKSHKCEKMRANDISKWPK